MSFPAVDTPMLQDQNGVYPALLGFVPASIGKRVAGRVIDAAIAMVVCYLVPLVLFGLVLANESLTSSVAAMLVWAGVTVAYAGFSLWMLLAKGSYPGAYIMGLQNVDVHTGRISVKNVLLKYVVEALLSGVTAGIGTVIVIFATMSKGTNRHGIDRAFNLIVIDNKAGRTPVTDQAPIVAPLPVEAPRPAAIAQVSLGTGPMESSRAYEAGVGFASGPGSGFSETMLAPGPSVAPEPARPTPIVFPESFGSPFAEPSRTGADAPSQPIVQVPRPGSDHYIDSTPFSPAPERAPQPVAPNIEVPQALAPPQPPPGWLTPGFDETVVDAGAFVPEPPVGVTEVILDGLTTISLDHATLLGRNPSTQPTVEATIRLPVADPTMQISKTHLAVGGDAGQWWVMDLRSTNGTRIIDADGTETRVEPVVKTPVPLGGIVRFGTHEIRARS